MQRSVYAVLAALIAAGLLVAGCKQQPAPAPTPAAAPAESPAAAPAAAPAATASPAK